MPVTGNTYLDLRRSIDADKQQRIRDHQARLAKGKRMAFALGPAQAKKLNLIAQGDSWFDYPLPFPEYSDIVAHLQNLPSMGPEVLKLAHYGEAAEDMLGVKKLHELLSQLHDPANGTFDAILFSGGGNDLAGDQFRLWLNDAKASGMDPAKGLNTERVADILGVVKAGYEDLIAATGAAIPIFAHSYDFPIPNGHPAPCGVGPWLKPGLDDRGWTDPTSARAIVRQLLLQFDEMLEGFAKNPANNFIHVKTQGTLTDAQWDNELHPIPDGFAAITGVFVKALRAKFPGRI
jgi:hypothetical protein